MTHRLWIAAAIATTVASPLTAVAQAPSTSVARISVADGIELELSMTGVPPGAADLQPRVQVQDGDLYRMIVDADGYARFAYAVRVEPRSRGTELVFRPVRLSEALRAFAPRARTYVAPFRLDNSLATLADAQWSGPIQTGDTITLDLFEHRDTGLRIGDAVTLVSASDAGKTQLAALRQRRAEDRPTLTVAGMSIRRAGRVLNADRPGTFASGHAVALGLGDGAGIVMFSAEPPQHEVPYGVATIQGNVLRFTLDEVEYECTGSEPVGPPGVGSVWMYVRREPLPYVKGFFTAAGDTIDVLMNAGRPAGDKPAAARPR